uniref:Uncharacterized protein n=1 Tax=Sphaerodactylus townsendi TaxID=933632 RepID=A0ACB8EVP5_9SAUR
MQAPLLLTLENLLKNERADSSYENNSWNDPAQNLVSEDGDNYENVEQEKNSPSAGAAQLIADGDSYENVEQEKNPLSPGAARLIAGLRLQLSLDHQVDKQDGGSEASTGSQSYEEMNGTLSPDTSKVLHTSNEEDADSYENMESPNSFTSGKEINVDPRGDGIGSVRKNLYIPFASDL